MKLEHKKQTNKVHQESLDSKITHAIWGSKGACAGEKAHLFVYTHFVGNGSEIEIKVQDKNGRTVEELKGKVFGNYFTEGIVVQETAKEELTFTAKLPKHGLQEKSDKLQVFPPVKLTNMQWNQEKARRGEIVKLSADIDGVPDETEVFLSIYEYDQDGAHDFISKFPCRVKDKKIELEWEYEYHEDTDAIPTKEELEEYGKNYNPPEYFFVVDVYEKKFGKNQESGLLEFKDWIEIKLSDSDGNPLGKESFIIIYADGTKEKGQLDKNGYVRIDNVPPGKYSVTFDDWDNDFTVKVR